MKCDVESHIHTRIDRTNFDFRFDDFFSNLPLQTIIYCVTDQPSITRSRRTVLNFKFSVLTFLRSMSCSTIIEQKLMFQLQSIFNSITCSNPRTTILHTKNRFKVARSDESYTVFLNGSIRIHGSVVNASRSESGDVRSILAGIKLFATPRPFCVALSPSVHWTRCFILLHSL